ncbi:hypothetical protein NCR_05096 [Burkholderia pseudomallei]
MPLTPRQYLFLALTEFHVQQNQARIRPARRARHILSISDRGRGARLLVAVRVAQQRRRSVQRRDQADRRDDRRDPAHARRPHQPVARQHADGEGRPDAHRDAPARTRPARARRSRIRRVHGRADDQRREHRARGGAHRSLPQVSRGARRSRAVPRIQQHAGVSRSADAADPGRVPRRAAHLLRIQRAHERARARHDRHRDALVRDGRRGAARADARLHRRDLRRRAARGGRAARAGARAFRADRAGPPRRDGGAARRVRNRAAAARARRHAGERRGHRARRAQRIERDPSGRGRDRERQRGLVRAHVEPGRLARANGGEHGGTDRHRAAEQRQRARRARSPTMRCARRRTAARSSTT